MLRAMSVRELFTDHYKPLRLPGCSRHTPAGHLAAINGLEQFWLKRETARKAPITCIDWTKPLTGLYLNELLESGKRSRGTYNKHLRHLAALWNFGREMALELAAESGEHPGVFRLPLGLDPLKETLDDPECWSQEELARLLVAAAETKGYVGDCPACYFWPSLILLDYSTGVRIEALMKLLTADLDLVNRWAVVRGATQKDKEGQSFGLQEDVCDVLAMMKPQRNVRLFGDWTMSIRTLTEHFRHVLIRAGLPATRKDLWHKLRKTFGTEVTIAAGEVVAQALLGHSHISVTRRYIDKKKVGGPNAAQLIRPPQLPIQLKLFRPDDSADAG
jgi:integrase